MKLLQHQYKAPHNTTLDGLLNEIHSLALATGKQDNKVFMLKEAMAQEDMLDFIVAMQKEIDRHIAGGYWKVVRRADHGYP